MTQQVHIDIEWAKDHRERNLGFAVVTTTVPFGVQVDQLDQNEDGHFVVVIPYMPDIFTDLSNEIARQNEKWGEQNHPLIGHSRDITDEMLVNIYKMTADRTRERNDKALHTPEYTLGWDDVLTEEVYEALSAPTPEEQVLELIQVAAVALQAALSIRRNEKRG